MRILSRKGKKASKMSKHSTRDKIRFQGVSAFANLEKAQIHLVQLAALADGRSDHINEYCPQLVALLEALINAVSDFNEGL